MEPTVPNTLLVYASSQGHVSIGSLLPKLVNENFDINQTISDNFEL